MGPLTAARWVLFLVRSFTALTPVWAGTNQEFMMARPCEFAGFNRCVLRPLARAVAPHARTRAAVRPPQCGGSGRAAGSGRPSARFALTFVPALARVACDRALACNSDITPQYDDMQPYYKKDIAPDCPHVSPFAFLPAAQTRGNARARRALVQRSPRNERRCSTRAVGVLVLAPRLSVGGAPAPNSLPALLEWRLRAAIDNSSRGRTLLACWLAQLAALPGRMHHLPYPNCSGHKYQTWNPAG